ncbi:metal ABC transporter permease [Thermosulfurimonas dismutans]|uniref:Zinc ABC transporter, inner membrane permease protein ZnuB n=1 Tax=Thermosulfurimonas dismutans TaxID=999894 RepID=A0A179D1Z2_9BACT|nr:iron chelate uptake ABC transporter family permease subunit [Thermosulfurimonas dismutans]OAQ20077.1 Zinc ABC transporter, inner membrane permease protein ZnuB [Thermosulfurimonas dismutans]
METFDIFRHACLMTLISGLIYPVIGAYFLLRRWVFLGVALPHLAMAGMALNLFILTIFDHVLPPGVQKLMAFGSPFLVSLLALVILALLERREAISEARIGAAYALALSLSLLFVAKNPWSQAQIMERLRGDLIMVSSTEVLTAVVVFGSVIACLLLFRREFVLVSFDPDLARILGKRVRFWNAFLLVLVGLSISVGAVVIGPLVVFSLMLFPPLATRNLVSGLNRFLVFSSLIGFLGAGLGFGISIHPLFDTPLGPTVSVSVAGISGLVMAAFKVMKTWRKARA